MRPMLHPPGFEEAFDDQVLVDAPPRSPLPPIIALIVTSALAIVALMWAAASFDPQPTGPTPTTVADLVGE
jgi:hypothetical protein